LLSQNRTVIRKAVFTAVLSVALLSGFVWTQANSVLVVLHTNDVHGQVMPRAGEGGLAEMATIIRRERPDLLLDGGDMFTGTMRCDEFTGKPMIEILGRLKFAAAALGNHEFDYGLEELRKRAAEAAFPILSANVKTDIAQIKPYTIVNVNGVRVGVIGLTV